MALRDQLMEFLREEGYVPQLDDDGDVRFKSEGLGFYFLLSKDDPNYVVLALPGVHHVTDEEDRAASMIAAYEATKDVKVAKVYLMGDSVWAVAEMFIGTELPFTSGFPRLLNCLRAAARKWTDARGGQS